MLPRNPMKMTLTFTAEDGTVLTEKTVYVRDDKKAIEIALSMLSGPETLRQMKESAHYYSIPA